MQTPEASSSQVRPESLCAESIEIEPGILYIGTPVILISTMNADGTPNLAPMSSAWALGWTMMLGLGRNGQTLLNLERERECVLNVPSDSHWSAVERLAPLTGRTPPPEHVLAYGGRTERRKFEAAGMTTVPSLSVAAPRAAECPLQLEAVLRKLDFLADQPHSAIAEVRVVRVHAHHDILTHDARHIDPARWRPLIYSFRHYYGLADEELGRSFRA
jgi:flavin reductase (DIM6/NTAB) family NADH-FMN oxidoreductase RutF